VPTVWRSGGILLGVNEDSFDVLGWSRGSFHIRVYVLQLVTLCGLRPG
jgi:hypothetical protein